MPRNGSGTYSLPQAPFVPNSTIASAAVNSDMSDIGAAITQSISKDGQTVYTGNQPMGGNKLTNLGNGTTATDSVNVGQVAGGQLIYGGVAGGTANAITLTPSPGIAAYAVGQRFSYKVQLVNTTAVTASVNGIGAGPVVQPNGSALIGGETPADAMVEIIVADISTPTAPVFHLQTVAIPATWQLPTPPQGRLTLVTATPVMAASQSAKTAIFYTPYLGNRVPLYNGTSFVMTTFAELTVATSDTTKSPAAIGVSKVNDWFVWNDAGTLRVGHGPDWTDDTTRSAGTALVRVGGVWLNNASITNGPAASRGTYVGTTRSDASSQLNFIFGAIGANGTAAVLGVWNAYNRVDVRGFIGDSTDSWNYSTATVRAANASDTMRVSAVSGLAEDFLWASYAVGATSGSSAGVSAGIGYDSTSAFSGRILGTVAVTTELNPVMGDFSAQPLGFHFMQACEYTATGTVTWIGDNGAPLTTQSGLTYSWRY